MPHRRFSLRSCPFGSVCRLTQLRVSMHLWQWMACSLSHAGHTEVLHLQHAVVDAHLNITGNHGFGIEK